MKTAKTLSAILVVAATLVAPSLFADERHRGRTDHGRDGLRTVRVDGRIRDIDRERNGFVIDVAGSRYRLFADADTRVQGTTYRNERRTRVRDLEEGDVIRATGRSDERGRVYVDHITLIRDEDDRRDLDDRYLRGTVTGVNDRRDVIYVTAGRSNRTVTVDARRLERTHRFDLDNLRRGDIVTIRGDWQRNGQFEAEKIEVDGRRRR